MTICVCMQEHKTNNELVNHGKNCIKVVIAYKNKYAEVAHMFIYYLPLILVGLVASISHNFPPPNS